jgi:hypothetical protein
MSLRAIPSVAALGLLLAACEYRPADGHGARGDSATAASGASARTDSAGGDVDDVSFPSDTAARNDVVLAPELRGDTSWRAVAEAERARRHPTGAPAAPLPRAVAAGDSETIAGLTPQRVNATTTRPAFGGEGATVLRAQILLDQAGFSPGPLDGQWGANLSKAAYWFQDAQGLPVSGFVDAATLQRLAATVGQRSAVVSYVVTPQDVAGPFAPLAESPYEQAKQPCLCYESAWEQIAERFHSTPELLARLNPGLDTTRLAAGARLWVPNVERSDALALVSAPKQAGLANATTPRGASTRDSAGRDSVGRDSVGRDSAARAGTARDSSGPSAAGRARGSAPRASNSRRSAPRGSAPRGSAPRDSAPRAIATPGDSALGDSATSRARAPSPASGGATVARIVVSRSGGYLQALDGGGRVILHAPSTLGTSYQDATPDSGALRVTRVVRYPSFHYNPKLYAEVADERPDARLPAGPNSPVGVAWLALSKPHYGIHGTATPATIGYSSSHGCIRLTNWDVAWLAEHTPEGTVVEFVP